jgi:NAD-dependent SIR2 family protein deacetylase
VNDDAEVAQAATWIREADGLLVTAGAGMGVDSGLPDFRGDEGFWRAYPALRHHGFSFEEIANPAVFSRDPGLAWGFYGHRLKLYRATQPHAGFRILLDWASRTQCGAFVFTSNVDGQFQKAGFSGDRIEECHGTIHALQCVDACTDETWPADDFDPIVDETTCRLQNELPRCPHCGALARPNILMFGDWNWVDRYAERQASSLVAWLRAVERLTVIEVGAGRALPTVRRFSERHGPRVVRINPREFAISPDVGIGIVGEALTTLQVIGQKLLSG